MAAEHMKKLTLSTETLYKLSPDELAHAAGGFGETFTQGCTKGFTDHCLPELTNRCVFSIGVCVQSVNCTK